MDTEARLTVLVSGYATAPAGTGLQRTYGSVGIVLEVDTATHRVVDAEFLVITSLANRFLRDVFLGARIPDDAGTLVEKLRATYLAPSADAMVVALRSAVDRYSAHRDHEHGQGHGGPAN